VLSWRRRWYVAGFDRDRQEARSFRLSRISGKVELIGRPGDFVRPEKVDLVDLVTGRPESSRVARVRITGPGAGQLRRLAEAEVDGELTISFNDPHRLARLITSAGTSAYAVEPPDLVAAVVARLEAAAGEQVQPGEQE
jgi:proteasome accessory factor B